jgi:hypothetical protein
MFRAILVAQILRKCLCGQVRANFGATRTKKSSSLVLKNLRFNAISNWLAAITVLSYILEILHILSNNSYEVNNLLFTCLSKI